MPRLRTPSSETRPDAGDAPTRSGRRQPLFSRYRRLWRRVELANSLTHGLGLVACLVGAPVLVIVAAHRGDAWQLVGASVFAATLLALYATSTVYHSLPPSRTKRIFRLLDHVAIYLLIAGTYTPFTLGVLRGAWGWSLLGAVWGLAALGILFKVVLGMRYPKLSTVFYVAMGWLAVVALRPLVLNVPGAGLALIFAGGAFYTLGVVFFAWGNKLRALHAVWHVFTLGGSLCHYLAVLWYSAPGAS